MKHALTYTVGIIGLAIGIVAGSALAQTTAAGPYYATPSWDQTLPASTRFIVLSNFNNQAVLDRETGLVWQRSPLTIQYEWVVASALCLESTVGGRAGWRLPTVNELARLFDPTVTTGVPLPSGHPFTGLPPPSFVSTYFWTLTLSGAPSAGISSHRAVGYELNFSPPPQVTLVLDVNISDNGQENIWCVTGGVVSGPQ
jgi:hypothetical protein